jgi:hypothetical protein
MLVAAGRGEIRPAIKKRPQAHAKATPQPSKKQNKKTGAKAPVSQQSNKQ